MFMRCEDGVLRHGKRAITIWAPENSDTVFFCREKPAGVGIHGEVIGTCNDETEAQMIYDLALYLVGGAGVPVRKVDSFFRQVSRCCRRLQLSRVEVEDNDENAVNRTDQKV